MNMSACEDHQIEPHCDRGRAHVRHGELHLERTTWLDCLRKFHTPLSGGPAHGTVRSTWLVLVRHVGQQAAFGQKEIVASGLEFDAYQMSECSACGHSRSVLEVGPVNGHAS
jgi:hypothetical protein